MGRSLNILLKVSTVPNKYIISAAAIIALVVASYVINFYFLLGYGVSKETSAWAEFGDFLGGVLNPILSFLALALLIKSLSLQNEANANLRKELNNNERTEKLKSFESLFFNMISFQKELFDSFVVDIIDDGGEVNTLRKVKAVIYIENKVENMRNSGCEKADISQYIDSLDADDQIFGLCRAFYIVVMMVSEKLKNSDGFSTNDRKSHIRTLVNFTDFSQLRLVIICIQFMEYESVKYMRESSEFREVIEEVGLGFNLY